MVLVELYSNAILVEGMKDRTSGEMIHAYQHLVDRLNSLTAKSCYGGETP
jgi:hypothetical protein